MFLKVRLLLSDAALTASHAVEIERLLAVASASSIVVVTERLDPDTIQPTTAELVELYLHALLVRQHHCRTSSQETTGPTVTRLSQATQPAVTP